MGIIMGQKKIHFPIIFCFMKLFEILKQICYISSAVLGSTIISVFVSVPVFKGAICKKWPRERWRTHPNRLQLTVAAFSYLAQLAVQLAARD